MEVRIKLNDFDEESAVCGKRDAHAKAIRNQFGVTFVTRDGHVKIMGDDDGVRAARQVTERILAEYRRAGEVSDEQVAGFVMTGAEKGREFLEGYEGTIDLPPHVWPKSRGQGSYVRSITENEICICVGPAGTGKTYLAVATAMTTLKAGYFTKMVLARPAVEAGEKLGYLPGDYQEKVNPYLRPLYDAIQSFLDPQKLRKYIDNDVIEVVPLAYMRGRNLDRAFIILDEAQNTTPRQMKMFLTRMGSRSKIVITGDVTQIDLPRDQVSGLVHSLEILKGIKGIGRVFLTKKDIVRHRLVQKIVGAYDRAEKMERS